MEKLEISNSADRDMVAMILFRNNYTVKLIKEKPVGSTRAKTMLAYEKNEQTT